MRSRGIHPVIDVGTTDMIDQFLTLSGRCRSQEGADDDADEPERNAEDARRDRRDAEPVRIVRGVQAQRLLEDGD